MSSRPRFLLIGMDGMNLPLLRRFVDEGCLPNFARLMARGSTNRLLPALPAWTPTNWATMVTGTTPGSHRLGGWTVRKQTDAWEAPRLDAWDSRSIDGVETIWDVADEAGLKTLIQFFPSAVWPNPLKHGYVVAPGAHDAPAAIAMPMRYFVSARRDVETSVSLTAADARRRTTDQAEEGAPPGSSIVRLLPATDWKNVPVGALAAELPIVLKTGERESVYLLAVPAADGRSYVRLSICEARDGAASVVDLPIGAWSAFYHRALGSDRTPVAMRFRVFDADATAGVIDLCRTQAYATRGFASPEGLDQRLVDACGPFYDWPSVDAVLGETELTTFADDLLYQGEWQVRAARYIHDHDGWDLHFSHWHLFDHINHPTINPADPDGPDYDPDVGSWMMECQRRIHQVGDRVLGQFLELVDDNTIVCVTSDHGMAPAHRWADIPARLAECGLLSVGDDGRTIDWSKSAAYMLADRGGEIYINLEGREPMGIVPPERYGEVQEEIVNALLDWRDPGTGKRPVALALPLQDAQIIGYWGHENGDVICTFNRGYGWGPPADGRTAGPGRGALHGSQIPTSETRHFTNMACFILAGPGIRAGYERDWRRYGLMRMVDLAPTVAHLLDLRPPARSIGAVLTDLLEG